VKSKIHIVEHDGIYEIVKSYAVKDGCIDVRHYGNEDGEYYNEKVPVNIVNTFSVITKGEFIRNESDTSTLNVCTISGGFNQINRLAYSYSVVIINLPTNLSTYNLYKSDLVYSDAGIKSTIFDMYSYHVNEPEQKYTEDRLDY
jgi:hypothetical protein